MRYLYINSEYEFLQKYDITGVILESNLYLEKNRIFFII